MYVLGLYFMHKSLHTENTLDTWKKTKSKLKETIKGAFILVSVLLRLFCLLLQLCGFHHSILDMHMSPGTNTKHHPYVSHIVTPSLTNRDNEGEVWHNQLIKHDI